MWPHRVLVVVALSVGLAGCADPPSAQPQPTPQATADGQLAGLPDCPPPPAASGDQVEGLTAPADTVVTGVQEQQPLTNVTGYSPMTPAQFEASFRTMDDVTILLSENEVFEAELLVTNGTHRTFLKATATCKQGSSVLAVVAPEVDAEGVPLPRGATATPTPAS